MRSLWALGLWSSQANAATYEELMRKPAGVGDVVVIVASMAILFAPMWFGMLKRHDASERARRLGWTPGWHNAAMLCRGTDGVRDAPHHLRYRA